MGWRKSVWTVLRDGARQSICPATPACSRMATPNSIDSLRVCRVHLDRSKRSLYRGKSSPEKESLLSTYLRANVNGDFPREVVRHMAQTRNFSGTMEACRISSALSSTRIAGIHSGRTSEASPIEPTYGVGPVRGADRDPKSKGDTPDDFRADDIHMAEPKEITKEKAAVAQEEPPDFQVKKMMPEWERPVVEEADSQRGSGDKVFEGKTRKLEGTAQYEGDTTGTESNEKAEGQYGAGPGEGNTTRA